MEGRGKAKSKVAVTKMKQEWKRKMSNEDRGIKKGG
jgi:hypothetical protein